MNESADIVIAGAGPAGLAAALALADSGYSVTLLEAKIGQPNDPRLLAMSLGSKLILERLGAWHGIDSTPIEKIHVSERGAFGRSLIESADMQVPALGFVVKYSDLRSSMIRELSKTRVEFVEGARVAAAEPGRIQFEFQGQTRQIQTRLAVIAEGGDLAGGISEIERRDYGQWAVVAQVETEKPHRNTAYERFTADGPVALLPYGSGWSLVWTASGERAQQIRQLGQKDFLDQLHRHFGDRLGRFVSVSNLGGFPLALKYSRRVTGDRIALIGNAAQTLHPVAGQGFNLGLRDARELARKISDAAEVGDRAMLEAYETARAADRASTIRLTDSLVRLFSNDIEPLRIARGLGLATLDALPAARNWFASRMMFGVGRGD